MDLITDLPKLDGYDSILTIIDQGCTKAAKFILCNKMIDQPGVALEYMKHLVPWFGVPKRIISDRNSRFTFQFSRALCASLGIKQNLSTAFHPRTDGQSERMNAWLKQYLQAWTINRCTWAQIYQQLNTHTTCGGMMQSESPHTNSSLEWNHRYI